MVERKELLVVQNLYKKAKTGVLAWQPTDNNNTFATALGEFTLIIAEREDPEYPDAPDYILRIYDAAGRQVQAISNGTLRPFMEEKLDGLNPYQLLRITFYSAQRKALGVDAALDKLLGLLDD